MRGTAVLACALLLGGCSFAFVRGPASTAELSDARCTESGFFPGLDALAGAAAIGTAVGGTIIEHTSDDGHPKDFGLYYGLPLVAVGIAYLAAATFGTNRVEDCQEVKQRVKQVEIVRPVPADPTPIRE